jgi:hypothetical protein
MLPAVVRRSWRRILSGEDPAAPICRAVPKPYLEMLIDPSWDKSAREANLCHYASG